MIEQILQLLTKTLVLMGPDIHIPQKKPKERKEPRLYLVRFVLTQACTFQYPEFQIATSVFFFLFSFNQSP